MKLKYVVLPFVLVLFLISCPTDTDTKTYTVTATAEPAAGGTVTRDPDLKKYTKGTEVTVKATLPAAVTGKHDLAFVFYSSTGEYLERHTATPTPANDGRARNVGFEIDRWWFE
jgi:hypothetical protein